MNNPTAAAVTHVLHNKRDFPSINGVEDLLVLSLGNGASSGGDRGPKLRHNGECSTSSVVDIVIDGVSETIDQMLGNAFCWNRTDYVRIQVLYCSIAYSIIFIFYFGLDVLFGWLENPRKMKEIQLLDPGDCEDKRALHYKLLVEANVVISYS